MKSPSRLLVLLFLPLFAVGQPKTLRPPDNLVVSGVPAIPESLAMSLGRYTEFRSATLASWHPTEREILIITRFAETPQVHLVRMPGGARTQLTFASDRVGTASFRPGQPAFFVFNQDRGGGEWFQNYRYDMSSGVITLLTDGTSRNSLGVWSRTGDGMAYTSTRRNGKDNDVYLIDPARPGSDRMLLQVAGGGWQPADWSEDGKSLLVREEISINESRLYIVDTKTGVKSLLVPREGREQVAYEGGRFSPDGKGVYASSDKGGEFHQLVYIDIATGKEAPVVEGTRWDVSDFALTRDGTLLAYVTNEDGIGVLRVLNTKTRKEERLPPVPRGIISGLQWHDRYPLLGFTLSSARSSADVYSVDLSKGVLERWTFSETGGLNVAAFAEPELVQWKSFDGRRISGFLYRPPKQFTGRRPVIINIHGGPESQARPGFLARNNYYINELGVAVVFPNVRGSSGYGKSFLKMDNGFLREDSYKDIGALLDWIRTQPDLDAERIMVTGGSYGGHMTLAVATLYTDRIRCALDVVGISNLVTFLERTESYRRDLRRVEYGDERDPKMREFLQRIAPLNHVDRIAKPLFVVQGQNDPRVPATESEQIVRALKEKGVPVWYLLAKDEGHGFIKKRNQDFQFYATILFIQEFLLR